MFCSTATNVKYMRNKLLVVKTCIVHSRGQLHRDVMQTMCSSTEAFPVCGYVIMHVHRLIQRPVHQSFGLVARLDWLQYEFIMREEGGGGKGSE